MREVQRPAVLREVRRVTDQAMIPGQVIRHRHDSVGVLERVPRQILSPWMRQNQHRRRGRLRQHIHMLAKAVRPLPDSAMQMTISHHKIRPGLLHRIQHLPNRERFITTEQLPVRLVPCLQHRKKAFGQIEKIVL